MRVPATLAAALFVALAFTAGGCGAIGWTVAQFAPPEKVRAEYKPPKHKTYLVFVDDIVSPVEYEPVKAELTEQLNQRLQRRGIASDTVDYGDMVKLMSATPEFNRLSVSEVGRNLGADVVLYVQVNRLELSEYQNTSMWKGLLDVSVRVVDVEQQRRLWPEDRPAGYPVEPVSVPQIELETSDYAVRLCNLLAGQTADKVIKLFCDHPKEL